MTMHHQNQIERRGFLERRRRRLWQWSLGVTLMIALEAAFFTWIAFHFRYLHGCWEVMREMEIDALRVSPWQSLSLMIPVWLMLGVIAYNLAMTAILRFQWLERQYLLRLNEKRD